MKQFEKQLPKNFPLPGPYSKWKADCKLLQTAMKNTEVTEKPEIDEFVNDFASDEETPKKTPATNEFMSKEEEWVSLSLILIRSSYAKTVLFRIKSSFIQ